MTNRSRDIGKMTKSALGILDRAITEHGADRILAMFSGGHDSLVATHIASQHEKFDGAVHVNTGIGIEQTRVFVREVCAEHGWRLREYHANQISSLSYEDMILKWGFPGPHHHQIMYRRLKERGLEQLARELPKGSRFALGTGCRSQESTRRMGNTSPLQAKGRRIWCSPIHDWSKDDCHVYMAEHGLRRNEVVDLIHKSGECLCGAFASPGELAEVELWFPAMGKYIRDLEDRVRKAGFPWGWEERPPKWWLDSEEQAYLFDMKELHPSYMCWSCERQGSAT